MSFSSGVFSLVAGNPVVTGTTISSTVQNNTLSDIATGLSTCLLKDGTQTATAAIPFITGVTTTSTTFAVFNTTATTINAFGGASVALNIGNAAGTNTFAGVGNSFSGTTASTSISTGAITTAGGVGITKALWVGGLANIAGAITAQSTINKLTITPPANSGTLTIADTGTLATSGAFSITLTATATTNVTLPTSGTLSTVSIATPQATTSGTSIEFTGIPAGTKTVRGSLVGVSTNGTSPVIIQIGPSGGVESSSYNSPMTLLTGASSVNISTGSSAGFALSDSNQTAAFVFHGTFTLTLENSSSNTWTFTSSMGFTDAARMSIGGGSKSISGALSRLKLTTAGGTDAFDAGEINLLYSG